MYLVLQCPLPEIFLFFFQHGLRKFEKVKLYYLINRMSLFVLTKVTVSEFTVENRFKMDNHF